MPTLQVRRGNKASLPVSAAAGEPLFAQDTKEVFMGTGSGVAPVIPAGIIVMWSGLLANIPSGWVLCDGANGTPDLRSKFVKGAAAGNDPGGTGGAPSYDYTPAGTVGAISATATSAVKVGTSASNAAAQTHTHPAPSFTGTQASIPTEPAYYALAFIMKL